MLCGNGKQILIEDPCHIGMLGTFINKGCSIVPIPVDADGMQTDYLLKCKSIGPVYVTPAGEPDTLAVFVKIVFLPAFCAPFATLF